MENYEILNEIDEGAFGIVEMARNKTTLEIVAIKKIKRKFNTWDECENLREIKSLKKLKHPNIIKLKEYFRFQQELFLVFEYAQTNLFKLYQKQFKSQNRVFPESFIQSLVYQTVSALMYMHQTDFFHRDLKPENLLITTQNTLKIADFGLAREIRSSPPYTDYIATRWYRAPEILLKSTNYNSPVDIWAMGCIMAELYLLKPLFSGNSEIDQLTKISALLGNPARVWPEGNRLAKLTGFTFLDSPTINFEDLLPMASMVAIDFLKLVLCWDSLKRPTAAKLLQHPFLEPIANSFHLNSSDDVFSVPSKLIKNNKINQNKNVNLNKYSDEISSSKNNNKIELIFEQYDLEFSPPKNQLKNCHSEQKKIIAIEKKLDNFESEILHLEQDYYSSSKKELKLNSLNFEKENKQIETIKEPPLSIKKNIREFSDNYLDILLENDAKITQNHKKDDYLITLIPDLLNFDNKTNKSIKKNEKEHPVVFQSNITEVGLSKKRHNFKTANIEDDFDTKLSYLENMKY